MTAMQSVDLDAILNATGDFSKLTPSGAGQYIQPGDYLFEISSIEIKNGYKGTSFIGNNTIKLIVQTDEEGLTPGATRNIVENLTGPNKGIALANMKAYLLAGCESLFQRKIPNEGVNPKFVARLLSADQPLKGVFVWCNAFTKPKQNGKGNVTVKNWKMATNEELAAHGLAQPANRAT